MNRPGPFIHSGRTTRDLMTQVLAALALLVVVATWRYGGTAILLVAMALLGGLLVDCMCDRRRWTDRSSVVACTVFALILPAHAPWWIALLGGAVATLFGKHFQGGFGENLFNPAALARVVLMGVAPQHFFLISGNVDRISQATPLAKELGTSSFSLHALWWGDYAGTLAESFPAATLLAGLVLVGLRTIDWRVPLVYLAATSFVAIVLPPGPRMEGHAPWLAGNPLPHLVAGGVLFTAFFMLTDPVTSPLAANGRILFALVAACYTIGVRFYTPYPDGAAMAVLLANALVPIIDRHVVGGKTV